MSKPGLYHLLGIRLGELVGCPIGIRHEGGLILIQAWSGR